MKISVYRLLLFGFVLIVLSSYSPLMAQETKTKLMVRAKAKDAKFIGTSIGGAMVLVRDATTGEILAKGMTTGETGNTKALMNEPIQRRQFLAESSSAGFLAEISIAQPTFVEVEVIAPNTQKHAAVKSTTQLWVFPGKDIIGDGVVLEVPGFVVNILQPQTHEVIAIQGQSYKIDVNANIVMMCGCPTSPEGIWNSNDYEINLVIVKEGKLIQTEKMNYTGKTSTYTWTGVLKEKGMYELQVWVIDPITGNTGLDRVNVILN
jgi:hypothetical protein